MSDLCLEDDLPIPRDSNGDWDWRGDMHRNPKLKRCILLPEEIDLLSADEKIRAENEYADRHEFSSRD